MEFTRAFYVAFLSGRSVWSAFEIGKEALKNSPYVMNGHAEGEKFILLPDERGDGDDSGAEASQRFQSYHQQSIFSGRQLAQWPPCAGYCTIGSAGTELLDFQSRIRLPKPPPDFEGREVKIYELIRRINEQRLVSLVGEEQIGKTTVAIAACNYIADRSIIVNGIVFFRCVGLTDHASFLLHLQKSLLQSCAAGRMHEVRTHQVPSPSPHSDVEEALVLQCLAPLKLLLVLDHVDDLLHSNHLDAVTAFRFFLLRLFDTCPMVKVLVVCNESLRRFGINNIGLSIVENTVEVGLLSLGSTLRLFARLAPSLFTAQAKENFIRPLMPTIASHYHMTIKSALLPEAFRKVLSLFGDGYVLCFTSLHMHCE